MIQPNTKEAYQLIHEGLQALSEASINGMCIDVDYCKRQSKVLDKRIKAYKKRFLNSKTGRLWKNVYKSPNINSDQQLAKILFEKKKIKPLKTTDKGNPSVDNETIELLAKKYSELNDLVKYKKLFKVKGTYIDNFIKETVNGFMHPGFNLHTTVTFRSSSQSPNFQNIPNRDKELRKIARKAFIPRKGNQLGAADFSGIEVAISCCVHKDKKMIHYVEHPEKNNMHTDIAKQVYMLDEFQKSNGEKILRKGAKNGFVFPQFYGDYYGNNAVSLASWAELPTSGNFLKKHSLMLMTGITVGEHLINKGIKNYNDFENHIKDIEDDFWNNRFKTYGKWKKNAIKEYHKKGHLQLITGFIYSGMQSKNSITNSPIQGPAFHCLLKSFIKINKILKEKDMETKLIGQIHDEMVFDIYPPELDELKEIIRYVTCVWLLEQWKWIIVPLEVEMSVFDIDADWSQDSKTIVLRK